MSIQDEPVESVWQDVGSADMRPPVWVVKDLIPTGITFIAGPPKSLKSAVELGACLAVMGVSNEVLPADLATVEETGLVMGLSMEADAGELRHTARYGMGVDVPDDSRFLVMNDPWRFRLDQRQDMKDLLSWVTRLQPRILFIDPLRNCHSLDENDSGGMVEMLQPLRQHAIRHNMAVVVVHHSKKIGDDRDGKQRNARADDMRGTSALFGMADAALTCTRKGRSQIHIDAVFKRGEGWQRTIQLGIWGGTSTENIDSFAKAAYELLAQGASQAQVAGELKLSKSKVSEYVATLKRIGALGPDGEATSSGSTIVSNAVRKFAPSAT